MRNILGKIEKFIYVLFLLHKHLLTSARFDVDKKSNSFVLFC